MQQRLSRNKVPALKERGAFADAQRPPAPETDPGTLPFRDYWSGFKWRKPIMAYIEKRLELASGRDHKKSVNTIVGIAIALVLGAVVLYGIEHASPNTHTADRPTMPQKAADSTHMPERL
jgi:hypothetical protein